jgi:hypothetical protein
MSTEWRIAKSGIPLWTIIHCESVLQRLYMPTTPSNMTVKTETLNGTFTTQASSVRRAADQTLLMTVCCWASSTHRLSITYAA